MYRLITESILGVHLEVDKLRFAPCVPPDWKTFRIHYRYRETFHHIIFRNGGGGRTVKSVIADGVEQADKILRLSNDHQEHNVEVEIE
jgi:cellobiose phosphorylase